MDGEKLLKSMLNLRRSAIDTIASKREDADISKELVEKACRTFHNTFPCPEEPWDDLPEGAKKDAYRHKMKAAILACRDN